MDLENIKEQWEELENWKKALITLIIGAALTYLIYMFMIQPKMEEKANLENNINNLKTQISLLKSRANKKKIEELTAKIEEIEKEIKISQKNLEKLQTFIPKSSNIDKLLIFVSKSIHLSKLDLERFQVNKTQVVLLSYDRATKSITFEQANENTSPDKMQIKLKQVPIHIASIGTAKSLVKFLNSISKSERYIRVDDVNLSRAGNFLKIDINLSTYYMEDF